MTFVGDPVKFDGDTFENVNNNTELKFYGVYYPNDFKYELGSAIVTLNTLNGPVTFTLEGDYFDITKFDVQANNGVTTLVYTGPLVPGGGIGGGGGTGGGSGVDSSTPISSNPATTAPVIPPDSPLGKPDAIFVGDNGNNVFVGGDGNELILGGGGNDYLSGRKGIDDLRGNAGADTLIGGEGNDYLRGGKDNDQLFGGKDDDRLFGDLGDDIIDGWLGDDTINGNAGNDQLIGGLGADRFVASKGKDTVLDFSLVEGDTVLILPGQSFELLQVGIDLVIRREQGDLTLLGVDLTAFQAANAIIQI
ncbi:calcium-binding protein [Synechococcus sp. CBW1108]|uniref:calcium-binding protein n=1 Tax=Synechococcus sp. CBW1108 TaxID=1353147 RepID=UPI0018CD6896|nr:hypothetical protein [Synechococcus sp. CBW1108]QPN71483.1 hypothetical protein H8F27_08040 [Synechococcus sp. CBW1108]